VIAFRDEELDVPAVVEELGRILNLVRALEPLANVHPRSRISAGDVTVLPA
jgi:hypothetical protein